MTSPWEEGAVYLLASVESVRIMVDLASLGYEWGSCFVASYFQKNLRQQNQLGDETQQTGPQLQGQ